MGDYGTIASLKVGATSFDLLSWTRRVTPVVAGDAMALRIGSEEKIAGVCEVTGETPAALAAAMAAAETALRAVAQDVEVIEHGATTISLLAANCIDAGPHITIEWQQQTSALVRRFSFEAAGRTLSSGGSGTTETSETTTTGLTSLGLQVQRRTGSISGTSSDGAFNTALAAWVTAHPWPNWVVTSERRINATANAVEYTLSATEVSDPLPATGDGVTAGAVEGSRTETVDSDRSTGRRLTTIAYDLVVDGDMQALANELEPELLDHEVMVKETIAFGSIRERRLQASWQILTGGDGTALLDWAQEWQITGDEWDDEGVPVGHQALRVISYPGTDPLIVKAPRPEFRYMQSGRAVGAGLWPEAPAPLFPANLAGPVEITRRRINNNERETTWRYEFVATEELSPAATSLDRPAVPTFWGVA